ncbi:MAG: hypothetical protein HY810_06960 [Candidatus Omnitrophica bacterium]|nr:hypothetical protein [Candidatus Omnitrophota bacterium]
MQTLQKVFLKFIGYRMRNKTASIYACGRHLNILHEKTKLTNDICLHSSVLIGGHWHNSSEGLWQVNETQDVLSITIDWKKIPLRQIWQIRRIENGFNWLVYSDVKAPLKIEKIIGGIMLAPEYEEWFNTVEQGRFPQFNESWESIFLQDTKSKIIGVKANGILPALIVENLQHGEILLQNAPQSCLSRALRVELKTHNELFAANRYKSFNLNLYLIFGAKKCENFVKQKSNQLLKSKELGEGSLRLKLSDSSVHLFWNDLQLSVNQGLHSALLVNNEWFDSSKCDWKIERINDQCIYIDIDWRPLPVKQSWQLNIIDENSFSWKVKTYFK